MLSRYMYVCRDDDYPYRGMQQQFNTRTKEFIAH